MDTRGHLPLRYVPQTHSGGTASIMVQETFWMDSTPPYRLDLTVWALRRRASNQIDSWDGTTYPRVLGLEGNRSTSASPSTGR